MKLLTTALVIVFLTTASAKPIGWRWRQHHDADITDNRWIRGWPHGNKWWSLWSSSYEDQSDESLESSSSESSESKSSEESSEEVPITDQTTPAVTTTTTEEGSTFTPEPDTWSTDGPGVAQTPEAGTPTPPAGITKPRNVTDCVTLVIPTGAPITDNRGDN